MYRGGVNLIPIHRYSNQVQCVVGTPLIPSYDLRCMISAYAHVRVGCGRFTESV